MTDWAERTVEEIAAQSPNALATGPFGGCRAAAASSWNTSTRRFQK